MLLNYEDFFTWASFLDMEQFFYSLLSSLVPNLTLFLTALKYMSQCAPYVSKL